jgi:hypothetical protein
MCLIRVACIFSGKRGRGRGLDAILNIHRRYAHGYDLCLGALFQPRRRAEAADKGNVAETAKYVAEIASGCVACRQMFRGQSGISPLLLPGRGNDHDCIQTTTRIFYTISVVENHHFFSKPIRPTRVFHSYPCVGHVIRTDATVPPPGRASSAICQ